MTSTIEKPFPKLLAFLDQLERETVWYRLEHVRDSIMVMVSVPDERWEVEFFEDGTVEVERFRSSGTIEGEDALDMLIGKLDGDQGTLRDSAPTQDLKPSPLR